MSTYLLEWLKILRLTILSGAIGTLLPHRRECKVGCYCLVAKLCTILMASRTVARHAPQSMGFPRQEFWNGSPFPSLGDLPKPRMSPALAVRFFTTEPPRKPV